MRDIKVPEVFRQEYRVIVHHGIFGQWQEHAEVDEGDKQVTDITVDGGDITDSTTLQALFEFKRDFGDLMALQVLS